MTLTTTTNGECERESLVVYRGGCLSCLGLLNGGLNGSKEAEKVSVMKGKMQLHSKPNV